MGMTVEAHLIYGIKVNGEDIWQLPVFDGAEYPWDVLEDLCTKHGCSFTELGYLGSEFTEAVYVIHGDNSIESAEWSDTIEINVAKLSAAEGDYLCDSMGVVKVCDALGLVDDVPYHFAWYVGANFSA